MPIKKALLILVIIAFVGVAFIVFLYYLNNKATEKETEYQAIETIITEEVRKKNQIKNMNNNLIETNKTVEEIRASTTIPVDNKEKMEREAMMDTLRKLNSIK